MIVIKDRIPEDEEKQPLASSQSKKKNGVESGYDTIPRRPIQSGPFSLNNTNEVSSLYSRFFGGRSITITDEDKEMQRNQIITTNNSGRIRGDLSQSMVYRADVNEEARIEFGKRFEKKRQSFDIQLHEVFLAFVVYLLIAVVAYSWTLEHWSIVDSLYFAVTTFTTVGTGDVYPSHTSSDLFTCLFALSGVTFLGIGLGVLGSNLVEAETQAASVAENFIQRRATSLFATNSKEKIDDNPKPENNQRNENVATNPIGYLSLILILLFILSLAGVIAYLEGWSFLECAYYSVISMTTIGYGDVFPQKETSKLIAIFFIPIAVSVTGHYISYVANYIIDERQGKFRRELLESINYMDTEQLKMLDINGDEQIHKIDYFEFMLIAMNKIDKDLWKQLSDQFDEIDESMDGILTMDELKKAAMKRKNSVGRKQELAKYKKDLWNTSFRTPRYSIS